jgi:hypothetical protein
MRFYIKARSKFFIVVVYIGPICMYPDGFFNFFKVAAATLKNFDLAFI